MDSDRDKILQEYWLTDFANDVSNSSSCSEDTEDHLIDIAAIFVGLVMEHAASYARTLYDKTPYHTSALTREMSVLELMNGHPERICNELGVHKGVFSSFAMTVWGFHILDLSRALCVHSGLLPDSFLTLVCTSCLHQTPWIPLDQAPHICTYSYTSPHVLLVAPRLIGIISPSWILCGLPVVLFRHSTAALFMYLVPLAEGYSSAHYSLVPGTPLTMTYSGMGTKILNM
jgi:hypothetical protein